MGSRAGTKMTTTELSTALKAVELYAARHPRPNHVTQTQAAGMLGVSVATVNRMIKSGDLRLNGVRKIPIEQVDRLMAV